MSVTRDPGYPAEYAELMSAFNQVADGYDAVCVLNAAMHLLAAAIQFRIKANDKSLEEAQEYAGYISGILIEIVKENYQRQASPGDVVVRPSQ